jgi:putative spermidine/putrescine transport system permease protein
VTRRPLTAGWLAVPPSIFLILLFVVPLAMVLHQSLFLPGFSLEKYERLLTTPAFTRGLRNSLEIAATAAVITAVLGALILVALHRWPGRRQLLLVLVLLMPFAANELVRIVSWVIFLSPAGPVSGLLQTLPFVDGSISLVKNRAGVLIGLVHVLLPFFVLTAYASTRAVDVRLMRAAQTLGALPLQSFLSVFLPLAMPGVMAATLLVFVLALGYYATPTALGGPGDTVLPTLIASRVEDTVDWGQAAALGMLLLAVTLIVLLLLARVGGLSVLYTAAGNRLVGRPGRVGRAWTSAVSSQGASRLFGTLERIPGLGAAARAIHAIAVVVVVGYLLAPIIVAFPASFTSGRILRFPPDGLSLRWYEDFFSDRNWTQGAATSAGIGLVVAIVAVALALCAAFALVRGTSRGKSQQLSFYLMPLIMPSIVTALGLFFLFVRLGIAYTPLGIALGHAVFALPYALLITTAAVQSFDWELDRAAQASGARWWRRLWDIAIPLLRPAVLAGMLFAFIASFTELVFALFMHSLSVTTLPVTMWSGILYEVRPTTAAASSLVIVAVAVVSVVALGGVRYLRRRRHVAAGTVGAGLATETSVS